MALFLYTFLITIFCSYSFRISPWLTLNTITIILYTITGFLKKSIKIKIDKRDLIVILLILLITISLIFSVHKKQMNHYMSYIFVFVFYYFILKNALLSESIDKEKVFKCLELALIICNIFLIVEFIIRNYIPSLFPLIEILQNNTAREYSPTYIGYIYRARGFAIESGHLALAYNAIMPIICGYVLKYNRKRGIGLILLSLIAYTTLISAGGFGSLIIGIVFTYIVFCIKEKKKLGTKLMVLTICVLVLMLIVSANSDKINAIVSKMMFSTDSGRFERWDVGIELIKDMNIFQFLFGYSPGYMSSLYNYDATNLYLRQIVEIGIIGAGLFLLLLILTLVRLIKSKGSYKYILLISFVSVCVHYFIVSDYAYPWLWLNMAIINAFLTNKEYYEMMERR